MKSKRIFIDTETSGTEKLLHGVHQIAGIIEIDGKIVDDFNYKCRLYPDKLIDPDALEAIGVTEKQIASYPSPEEVCEQLSDLLDDYNEEYHDGMKFTIFGYNVNFDIDFLKRWFDEGGSDRFAYVQNWKPVDILAYVRLMVAFGDKKLARLGNHRLSTLCHFFDIEIDAHDALSDIQATRKLWIALKSRMIKLMRKK